MCCTSVASSGCGTFIVVDDNLSTEDACLDRWSLLHFGAGYALSQQLGDRHFIPGLGLLFGYELIEPEFWPGYNESELNRNCDVVVGAIGWAASARD